MGKGVSAWNLAIEEGTFLRWRCLSFSRDGDSSHRGEGFLLRVWLLRRELSSDWLTGLA